MALLLTWSEGEDVSVAAPSSTLEVKVSSGNMGAFMPSGGVSAHLRSKMSKIKPERVGNFRKKEIRWGRQWGRNPCRET
jgi:hypothetical protein